MIARRKFLRDFSAAAAATITLAPIFSFGASAVATGKFRSLSQLNYAGLAEQLNTFFRVQVATSQLVWLKLIHAERYESAPVMPGCPIPLDAGYEKFSLIFNGPKDVLLPPAIHPFEHDQLGRFKMYIGQIGTRNTEHVCYETVFNRPPIKSSTILT